MMAYSRDGAVRRWLCRVADRELLILLVELQPKCRHVWLWRDGSERQSPILT
jgi:hypothetical protein